MLAGWECFGEAQDPAVDAVERPAIAACLRPMRRRPSWCPRCVFVGVGQLLKIGDRLPRREGGGNKSGAFGAARRSAKLRCAVKVQRASSHASSSTASCATLRRHLAGRSVGTAACCNSPRTIPRPMQNSNDSLEWAQHHFAGGVRRGEPPSQRHLTRRHRDILGEPKHSSVPNSAPDRVGRF